MIYPKKQLNRVQRTQSTEARFITGAVMPTNTMNMTDKEADKIYSSSGRQRNIPSLLLCKNV